MATAAIDDHGHAHDHPEWLAHHFETPEQQFDAGKLGIWLFLAQEVLFFSGLFVAYAVYRFNHPEVFVNAHHFLNPTLGALNTIVLLASSLAIAWGVRAAQRNDQSTLFWVHVFTMACAGVFMGVKTVEYAFKFDEGLLWASAYSLRHVVEGEGWHTLLPSVFWCSLGIGVVTALGGWVMYRGSKSGVFPVLLGLVGSFAALGCGAATIVELGMLQSLSEDVRGAATGVANLAGVGVFLLAAGLTYLYATTANLTTKALGAVAFTYALSVVGLAAGVVLALGIQGPPHEGGEHGVAGAHAAAGHAGETHAEAAAHATPVPQIGVNEGNFFSIYFAMTGVHAIHIVAGMLVFLWIVGRIARGDFGPDRYGPVEYTGLYWHLVDLVWIYLFPLLYLIH